MKCLAAGRPSQSIDRQELVVMASRSTISFTSVAREGPPQLDLHLPACNIDDDLS